MIFILGFRTASVDGLLVAIAPAHVGVSGLDGSVTCSAFFVPGEYAVTHGEIPFDLNQKQLSMAQNPTEV